VSGLARLAQRNMSDSLEADALANWPAKPVSTYKVARELQGPHSVSTRRISLSRMMPLSPCKDTKLRRPYRSIRCTDRHNYLAHFLASPPGIVGRAPGYLRAREGSS